MRFPVYGLLVLILSGCASSAPTVQVEGESLLGKYVERGNIAAFLGVPFAEPPVGDLRWREPQPLADRQQRRDATAFAPACVQTMRILDWYRDLAETFGGSRDYYADLEVSEDCLYLNVWTPDLEPGEPLPVMVWIHGGSNKSGWAYEPNYHGHKLAPKGVVVVTVAYRFGAFGFLSHPELDPDEPVANFGLWDIVAALEWINRNIGRFGGDPGRVTLFGESAGAQDILALMFAESAQELFHRASLQSTAGYGMQRMGTLDAEQQRGLQLAEAVGLDREGSLDALRQVPADRLLEVYDETFPGYYHSPVVDGQLIERPTWEGIESGDFRHAIIIGTNRDEWRESMKQNATPQDVEDAAARLSRLDPEAALAAVADEPDLVRALDRLFTADFMLCPSLATAKLSTAAGNPAWAYYFSRARDDAGGRKMGAYHGAEYPYIFGVHDDYMTTNAVDVALTEAMQAYWVRFAATGDPNGGNQPDWPQHAQPGYRVQELGASVRTIEAPEAELCATFRPD